MLPKTSKFRHVFGTAAKPEQKFSELKLADVIWDCSNFVDANRLFFGVSWGKGGGGRLALFNLDKPGKKGGSVPVISGHTAKVVDWSFSPFNDYIVATGSEDLTVKLWQIPDGGLTQDLDTPLQTMTGHSKKVGIVHFHPCAENVLLTAADNVVKLWDVAEGASKVEFSLPDMVYSATWSRDGSQIVTTCKDKQLRIFDARTGDEVAKCQAHKGSKPQRSVWMQGPCDKILSGGIDQTQGRELRLYDPRNMGSGAMHEHELDNQVGVLMLLPDHDVNMCYVGGKGDGNIRYFEIGRGDNPITYLDEFSTSTPQRGLSLVPKIGCDTKKGVMTTVLKLDVNSVTPITMVLPRKESASVFQEDMYPDTFSNQPALSSDEFFAGVTKEPLMVSLREEFPPPVWQGFLTKDAVPTAADIAKQKEKVEACQATLARETQKLADMEARAAGTGKAAEPPAPAAPAPAPAAEAPAPAAEAPAPAAEAPAPAAE